MKFKCILIFWAGFVFSQDKINGLSFVASNNIVTTEDIKPVIQVNANWVTLMPFAFMKTINDTSIRYNSKRQWIGERIEGVVLTTKLFKKSNIKVMIKPQIWIPNGFTGNILMKNNEDWIVLEKNYQKFILDYALAAQETKAELFCLGTELKLFVQNRPEFFNQLIKKIRNIYTGKLTYAENWDCYQQVPFWNLLDYIGIDAYFALENNQTPNMETLAKAWVPIKKEIKKLAKSTKKQVIFTEFGYQSKDFAANKPWDFTEKTAVNLEAQNNALAIIIETFWRENWFAGGFLWKWYDKHEISGGLNNTDYTVQNKPAEKIISKLFKKHQ